MIQAFDPARALTALTERGVRFVVIGGIAARLLGSPTVTRDLDVCYARDPGNLERLTSALRDLHARLRDAPPDVPFRLDGRTLAAGDHFTFVTDAGDLDILGAPSGSEGFDQLARNASAMDLDGIRVLVADIDDLIAMKRASGRPKDRIELEVLGALRDEIEAGDRRVTREDAKLDTPRAITHGFDTHDLDAIMKHFTDDAVFESPRGPDACGTRFVGANAVREAFAGRFAGIPDVRYLDDTHFVARDRGASEWTLRGTTTSGEFIEVRGCDLWTFAPDGRVAKKDSYWKIRVPPEG
ncbi:MAG: nuclear transport factor 2 family protein [Candidatus Limnocylindria bacterium]